MNQTEVTAWLTMLPYFPENGRLRRCANHNERIEVIEDLLRHATKDHMSPDDRVTCVEAIQYLRVEEANGETGERREVPRLQQVSEDDRDDIDGVEDALHPVL